MKQELLIAVVLLATGGALWIWQNDSGNVDQESLFPADIAQLRSQANPSMAASGQVQSDFQNAKIQTFQSPSNTVVQPAVSWQNPSNAETATSAHYIERAKLNPAQPRVQKSVVPEKITTDCPASFRIESSDAGSEDMLRRLSVQVNQGGPIQSTFKMRSFLFDVELNAEGRFWQIGQGSRKSRMELAFIGQSTQRSVLQICDGRFVFHVTQFNGTQKIKFLDLQRLQNREAHLAVATMPAAWVGQGSLADLFVHLADSFKLNPPTVSQSDLGETTYSISGHWKPERLYQVLSGVVKQNKLSPVIQLGEMPPQLPHAVNVVVKTNPGNPDRLVPIQLEFFRFNKEDSDGLSPLVDVRFERFEVAATLDDRLFVLQSSDGEAVDVTDIYNRRIDAVIGDQGRVADINPAVDGQFGTGTTLQ